MSRAAARWAFPPAVILPCFPCIWDWCGLWALLFPGLGAGSTGQRGSCPLAMTPCRGVLVLGAGGPGCPQEVLASVLNQAGWEGPQNLAKEQEKGLSQVIFGMKQIVLTSSP